jgi:ribosomal protein L16 Arg81 hydroxylase
MTTNLTLADLVAPVEVGHFLGSVLGGSPRRFSGPEGRFAHLVPWGELDRVLGQNKVEFPRLRLALDGEVVPLSAYTELMPTRRSGLQPLLRSVPFAEKLRAGSTLILDAAQDRFAPVGELAVALEHDLRESVSVNLYASWGKTHGFEVHWDDHDALIVQLSGRKRWRLHGFTRTAPLPRDAEQPPQPPEEPIDDFVLTGGDVLYLPRGQWHDVAALGEESLHLTIGFNRATGVDLVTWLADQVRSDETFRVDLPRFATAQQLEERGVDLRERLIRLLDDDVVTRFLTDRDVQAPAHLRLGLPWSATFDPLPADDDMAVRLLTPRAVLTRETDTVVLAADGRRLVFAETAEPVLTALLPGRSMPIRELLSAAPALDRDTLRALLIELLTQGVLAPR